MKAALKKSPPPEHRLPPFSGTIVPDLRPLLLAASLVLTALPAHSAAVGLSAPTAADADSGWLEYSRYKLHQGSEWTARKINSWFGDQPFENGGKVSNGRLKISTLWRRDKGTDLNVRFSVRMHLPNLRDKAYLFFGRENEAELISDTPEAFTRQQQLLRESHKKDDTFFAGIGTTRNKMDFRLGIRSGYKVYAQARYRHGWSLSERDALAFRQTAFWRVHDGFGATTSLDYEHYFGHQLSARWLNAATITEDTHGWEWSTSLGLYKKYDQLRELSLELLANSKARSEVSVEEYGVRMKWSQPLLQRNWLTGELIVGHFWPRASAREERERSWALGIGAQMHF